MLIITPYNYFAPLLNRRKRIQVRDESVECGFMVSRHTYDPKIRELLIIDPEQWEGF